MNHMVNCVNISLHTEPEVRERKASEAETTWAKVGVNIPYAAFGDCQSKPAIRQRQTGKEDVTQSYCNRRERPQSELRSTGTKWVEWGVSTGRGGHRPSVLVNCPHPKTK